MITNNLNELNCNKLIIIFMKLIFTNCSKICYLLLQAVKIHSYKYFETLLSEWEGREWLRNYSWMKDEALPKIKKLNASAPDEYISDMMVSSNCQLYNKNTGYIMAHINSLNFMKLKLHKQNACVVLEVALIFFYANETKSYMQWFRCPRWLISSYCDHIDVLS